MTTMLTRTDTGRRDNSLLTPDDTYTLYLDALYLTSDWATTRTVRLVGDPVDEDDPVTDWQVEIRPDEGTAEPVVIGHKEVEDAMWLIATEPDGAGLARRIVAQVRHVLSADTHEELTDEMCQLDVIGFNAIIRIAALGRDADDE